MKQNSFFACLFLKETCARRFASQLIFNFYGHQLHVTDFKTNCTIHVRFSSQTRKTVCHLFVKACSITENYNFSKNRINTRKNIGDIRNLRKSSKFISGNKKG